MEETKKVIISGCNGQDGSYMIEYLLNNTNHIIIGGIRRTSQAILSNIQHLLNNPRFKLHTLDITDVHSITDLIRKEKPDYFINFAANTFVADSWNYPALHLRSNSEALIHILEAVKNYAPSCRVYSSGSSEQFGDVKYSPQDENHPMSPRSIYGVSKCAASHICKVYRESYNLYVVHGILFNHESKKRQSYFVSRKISLGVARIKHQLDNHNYDFEPILIGNINSRRDWSHSADFVDGIWRMLNQENYRSDWIKNDILSKNIREYVLSSDNTYSVKYFIETAFSNAGISGVWFNLTNDPLDDEYILAKDGLATKRKVTLVKINKEFFRPADVELLCGNSTKARTELGWNPKYSFDDLVKEMVENDIAELNTP